MPEIARERLRASVCIKNLEWVESEIRERLQQLDLAEVPALRLYADIQLRKMAKVLPDLKAVEHTGQVDVGLNIVINAGE